MLENSKQKDFFYGALVGGTVAVLTTLFFTTQTGRRIQRQIGSVYDEIEENVKDTFQDSKDNEDSREQAPKKASHAGNKPQSQNHFSHKSRNKEEDSTEPV